MAPVVIAAAPDEAGLPSRYCTTTPPGDADDAVISVTAIPSAEVLEAINEADAIATTTRLSVECPYVLSMRLLTYRMAEPRGEP